MPSHGRRPRARTFVIFKARVRLRLARMARGLLALLERPSHHLQPSGNCGLPVHQAAKRALQLLML